MLASVLIRARTRRCEPFQLEVWLHFCGALAMALDQGQCPFLRFECAVALPGALDVLRSQGGTFTFDHTQGDWGCFMSRKPVMLSHICQNSAVWFRSRYSKYMLVLKACALSDKGYLCDPYPNNFRLKPYTVDDLTDFNGSAHCGMYVT